MSRDKQYQRLLNSKRWRDVKSIVWRRANGLCERCIAEGKVVPGIDCHHIKPVESGKSIQEMERLCYDYEHNIQLLCIPCHIAAHQAMRSHTNEELKANRQRRQERWRESMIKRFTKQAEDTAEPTTT